MSLDSLKQRISAFYNEKQASDKEANSGNPDTEAINMKDPQESPTPQGGEPLKHDGDDASKQALPASGLTTTNNQPGKNNIPGGSGGEASGKAPSGAGQGGHSAKGGDASDAAVSSPTDPSVAKTSSEVAAQASNLVSALRANYEGQPQAAVETQQPKEAEAIVPFEQPQVAENLAADLNTEANAYHKIAELVLNYEEGRQLVNDLADREFGKEAASQLINEAETIQVMEDEVANAEMQGAAAADEILKSASEEDVDEMQKLANAHGVNMQNLDWDFEQEAYDLGCKQAAMAMDGGGEIPGDVDNVSLDEVAAVIMQMVEAGELDPQTAEAVLQQLAGADGGGEGGMPPGMEGGMPPGAEGIPPEVLEQALGKGAAEELSKAASVIDQVFGVDEAEALRTENEQLKQQLQEG